MFRIYAFSENGSWSANAESLDAARQIAKAFERRDLMVRIYERWENETGDSSERLISGPQQHGSDH